MKIALVPAAGSGSRMASQTPKQYLNLAGKPLIWHTLAALSAVAALDRIVVVISSGFDWNDFPRLTVLRCGGESRAQTVLNGLQALQSAADAWVLVHDAARPCLDPALVSQMIAELSDHPVGGILAVPVADTLKLAAPAADAAHIAHTHPRDGLWQAQTPQMFRLELLTHALQAGMGPDITDEASALEKLGLQPRLVMGSPWNLKVTYPQDLLLAELILAAKN